MKSNLNVDEDDGDRLKAVVIAKPRSYSIPQC